MLVRYVKNFHVSMFTVVYRCCMQCLRLLLRPPNAYNYRFLRKFSATCP